MQLNTQLRQSQQQTQTLGQKQQQSLKLLQMNSAELLSAIERALEENPLLEYSETTDAPVSSFREDSYELLLNYVVRDETLGDVLRYQLHTDKGSCDQRIGEFLIDSLDANGYLTISVSEAAKLLQVSKAAVERTLTNMQRFEPYGVFARSLKECLLLQLERMNAKQAALAVRIVKNHLSLLADNRLPQIALSLKVSLREVSDAAAVIRTLNPLPAAAYQRESLYIYPDVRVIANEQGWKIEVLSRFDSLRIVNPYQDTQDVDTARYLHEQMRSAKELLEGIQRRNATLVRIVGYILERQSGYFLRREPLQAMTMSELAAATGFHKSTVSRCVNGKYLEFEGSLLPLKLFFPAKAESGDCASLILHRIKAIIHDENTHKPFTDEELCQLLAKEGIHCSRRTIAKYRMNAGIPNAAKRKSFGR